MTRSSGHVVASLAVLFVLGHPSIPTAQPQPPSVYVGPQIRDGFLDIDAGVRDSIRDIQQEFKRYGFRLTGGRDDATLVLIVVTRGIVTNGSIGVSSASTIAGIGSGFGVVTPNSQPTVTTLLRVGTYEKQMQSVSGTWTGAAHGVVDDVMAWWEANQQTVRAIRDSR